MGFYFSLQRKRHELRGHLSSHGPWIPTGAIWWCLLRVKWTALHLRKPRPFIMSVWQTCLTSVLEWDIFIFLKQTNLSSVGKTDPISVFQGCSPYKHPWTDSTEQFVSVLDHEMCRNARDYFPKEGWDEHPLWQLAHCCHCLGQGPVYSHSLPDTGMIYILECVHSVGILVKWAALVSVCTWLKFIHRLCYSPSSTSYSFSYWALCFKIHPLYCWLISFLTFDSCWVFPTVCPTRFISHLPPDWT